MSSKIMLPSVFLLICSIVFAVAIADHNTSITEDVSESVRDDSSSKIDSGDENKKLYSQILSDLFHQTPSDKFYVSKLSKNWEDAGKSCEDVGMKLASITSQKEQLELFKFLFVNDLVPVDDFSGYWLSGQQLDNRLYNWTAINKPIDCWGWLPGEPNDIDGLMHCVELKFEAGSVRLGWNNVLCERKLRFICQQLPGSSKDSLFNQPKISNQEANTHPGSKCYWFYNRNHLSVPYKLGYYHSK